MLLHTDRLSVLVAEPGIGWANTTRFDRTCVVTSIVLDGLHRFCTPEQIVPGRPTTGGIGLTAEFQSPKVIEDAPLGQRYHKIGVGTLLNDGRTIGPYSAVDMEAEPYPTQVEQLDEATIRVAQEGTPLNGYAFQLERLIRLEGNALTIWTRLRNRGEKRLPLEEYNHNFLNIDDHPVGPGYALELSYDMELAAPPRGAIAREGRLYTWDRTPEKPFFITSSAIADASRYGWELSHLGMTVAEEVSQKPVRTALWGVEHVISAEVFVGMDLAPEEEATWSRTWTFGE